MEIASLYSGGKDSAYATWITMGKCHEIRYLVSMIPHRIDSYMFHHQNIHLINDFASCSSIPLIRGETNGVKESELKDLKSTLEKLEIDGVVSGAISSEYQKKRIENICDELGVYSITPLWGIDPIDLLNDILNNDFKVIITSVSAEGFDKSWLGREINRDSIIELRELNEKYGVNPSGEGGEYETLVLDAPFYKKRIRIIETEKKWGIDSGSLDIKKTELIEKY